MYINQVDACTVEVSYKAYKKVKKTLDHNFEYTELRNSVLIKGNPQDIEDIFLINSVSKCLRRHRETEDKIRNKKMLIISYRKGVLVIDQNAYNFIQEVYKNLDCSIATSCFPSTITLRGNANVIARLYLTLAVEIKRY